jgi:hypothetical protein
VVNSGYLPTYVSRRAQEIRAVQPISVQLALPEGASLVVGEAFQEIGQFEGGANKGALWSSGHPSAHLRKLEWVVRAPVGANVGITVVAQRAGTVRGEVNLG